MSAPPPASATATPPTSSAPRQSEGCEALFGDATTVPWEIAYLGGVTAVVVARVDAVGPARWTTSDGRQPDDPFAGDAQIVTPVQLELAESVTGDLAPGTLRVHLLGGTVGCSSLRMSGLPEPQLVVGHRYAFFLDRITTSAPPSDGLSLRIFDAWEVDAAGVVHTCCEGDLTLGTFRAAVIAAAAAHPRPTD